MSNKLNLLVYLNAYRDANSTNNPSMSQFKWQREMNGLAAEKPQSVEFCLTPGETKTLFSGVRALASDLTTEYDIYLKAGGTYVLEHVGGTAPSFRTLRTIGSDATTQVQVTKSANITTFTSIAGTLFDFTPVAVGDEVLIGQAFNASNRGRFKVLAKTTTSISVENSSSVAETVTLGLDFENEFRVYSAAGVQKGDKISLGAGFSLVSQNTYEVTAVQDNLIEFFFTGSLPDQSGLLAPTVVIYSSAKKLVYLESDKKISTLVNGSPESDLEPVVSGSSSTPGILLKTSVIYSFEITNESSEIATLYFVSVE